VAACKLTKHFAPESHITRNLTSCGWACYTQRPNRPPFAYARKRRRCSLRTATTERGIWTRNLRPGLPQCSSREETSFTRCIVIVVFTRCSPFSFAGRVSLGLCRLHWNRFLSRYHVSGISSPSVLSSSSSSCIYAFQDHALVFLHGSATNFILHIYKNRPTEGLISY